MELLAELRVGLPPLFYYRLIEIPDDWGFVLKLHAFFEGTLTRLLQDKLRLRTLCRESLTPRDSFTSRVYLASRMDLIEPDYRAFLLALNRLRNDITHNVRYLDFKLRHYVDNLSDTDFRRTAVMLGAGLKNVPADSIPLLANWTSPKSTRQRHFRTAREQLWHNLPRFSLWCAGLMTLDLLALHFHFEKSGGTWSAEPDIEAKLQDLLHDPAVLAYRRKVEGCGNEGNA
jgi:hypothetical protein